MSDRPNPLVVAETLRSIIEAWRKIRRDWFPHRSMDEHMAVLAHYAAEQQALALRVFRARAHDAGVIGDPTHWFPIRDAAEAELNRLLEREGRES